MLLSSGTARRRRAGVRASPAACVRGVRVADVALDSGGHCGLRDGSAEMVSDVVANCLQDLSREPAPMSTGGKDTSRSTSSEKRSINP